MHYSFKNRFLKAARDRVLIVFSNPYLLSLFITIGIIFSLPPIFSKYTAKIISKEKDIIDQFTYYAELGNNGFSNKVDIEISNNDRVGLRVYKANRIVDQWNFDGKLIPTYGQFWNDIDGDGFKELFIFTYHENKIFLNCLTPLKNKILFKNRFIDQYLPVDDRIDCSIYPIGYFANNNGMKNFYFIASTGFSLKPRKLYAYDLVNDTLYYSENYCAALSDKQIANYEADLNIITTPDVHGNCSPNAPYSDMFAWLMIFDKDLKFKADPIRIGYYPSSSDLIPFNYKNKSLFVVMNIYNGSEKRSSSLTIYDLKLKKIKEKYFEFNEKEVVYSSLYYDNKSKPDYFFQVTENGFVEKLDRNLKVVEKLTFNLVFGKYYLFDLDQDGNDELVFQSKDLDHLIISRNDFSEYEIVNCPGVRRLNHCSIKLNGNSNPELFAQFGNIKYLIKYKFNSLYSLRYPLYAGIYLGVLVFIFMIQKAQKYRAEIKQNTEKKIAELQMRAIKNQVDPHFVLNILNSIGSLIYKDDREKADYVFGKYSKMLRSTILNSDKIITTLSDELDYVKYYLELELFRLNYKFSYELKIDADVDTNIKIPKMLVHTFAENSIKHGLRHLESEGKLLIHIYSTEKYCNIVIRDNGIGRQKAKQIEVENTSKGLGILTEILDLFFSLTGKRLTYTIKDLFDENNTAAGTEVIINIPFN